MNEERTLKVIKFGQPITFVSTTHDYGRAEFVICPVFRRGIMRELYIDPRQQPQYFKEWFQIDLDGIPANQMHFSGYPKENDPEIWRSFWCKEHKCFSIELYVSASSHYFEVQPHFGDTVDLEFH